MKRISFILSTSIIIVVALFILEQFFQVSYIYKVLAKVLVFIIFPIYYAKTRKKDIDYLPSRHTEGLKTAAFASILVFTVVLGAYFILQQYIDFSTIEQELAKIGVTPLNYVFIAVYITFGNSFIEEFFFRGHLFMNLKKENKRTAYIASSLLFAVYHIGIFLTWFSAGISAVALVGLFFGGMIFNYLNEKSGTITNSWIVHIAADAAIVMVGFMLFGFI
ncbi:MAG: CPBP family intramembrane glutamic endopeptidase [Nanoarchaeota archaeon]